MHLRLEEGENSNKNDGKGYVEGERTIFEGVRKIREEEDRRSQMNLVLLE